MSRQTGPQGSSIVSQFLVSLDPSAGYFTTIQSAIDAAVAFGASNSAQAEVLIADGQYTENLTLQDYVNLVGLSSGLSSAVIIIGSATYDGSGSFAATNVTFLEPEDSQALLLSSASAAVVSLSCVTINGSDGGGYGLNVTGAGVTATIRDSFLTAGSGTNSIAVQNGVVNLISCQSLAVDSGSFVFGGTLNIDGCQFVDWYQVNNTIATININNSTIDSSFGDTACIACATGSPTISAYNSKFISINSSNYFISGSSTFSYGNIESLGSAAIIDPLSIQVGSNSYNGNLTFDGGNTTLDTDGQVWIGSSSGNPAPAVLTQGSGVTITNAANSITIAATAVPFTWQQINSGSNPTTLVANNGYIVTGGGTVLQLPNTGDDHVGDTYKIVNQGGDWILNCTGFSEIQVGALTSSPSTGSVASTQNGDSIELTSTQQSTIFTVTSSMGNLTVI